MKIITPTSYEIELTDEENKIITDCEDFLRNIRNQIRNKDCTSLIDSRYGSGIGVNDIDNMIDKLEAIELADIME